MNVLEILAAEVGEVPSLLHSHLAGIQNNMKESESDPTSIAIIESKLTTVSSKGRKLTFGSGSKVTCANTSSVSGSAYISIETN